MYWSESCISLSLIPVVPIVMKLGICTVCMIARDSSTKFYINPFTTRVPIVIDPSHTLVYELSGSNEDHTRHDQTLFKRFYINPFGTRVSVFIGSSH